MRLNASSQFSVRSHCFSLELSRHCSFLTISLFCLHCTEAIKRHRRRWSCIIGDHSTRRVDALAVECRCNVLALRTIGWLYHRVLSLVVDTAQTARRYFALIQYQFLPVCRRLLVHFSCIALFLLVFFSCVSLYSIFSICTSRRIEVVARLSYAVTSTCAGRRTHRHARGDVVVDATPHYWRGRREKNIALKSWIWCVIVSYTAIHMTHTMNIMNGRIGCACSISMHTLIPVWL